MDRLLPLSPQSICPSTPTFSSPCLDGSLLFPELYDWHFKHSADHPLYIYSVDQTTKNIEWGDVAQAIYTGVRVIRGIMDWTPGVADIPVVAILAPSETISYSTFVMSIMRAGYIPFPLSPRNSAAALAHLLSKTGVKHVFLGHDEAMFNLREGTVKILEEQYPDFRVPGFSPLPMFLDLYDHVGRRDDPEDLPYEKRAPGDVALFLHSSGSTAFPKPISWTHHRLIQFSLIPYFGERDVSGLVFSVHGIPMYHGMGLFLLFWATSYGLTLSSFEPKFPPIISTIHKHFQSAVATDTDIMCCVPSVLEEWSYRHECLKWLATRTGVFFGGGPLNRGVGDHLRAHGVVIYNLYGSTEIGAATVIFQNKGATDYDWEYFRFAQPLRVKMVPYGEETYELVVLMNEYCIPCVTNTKIDGVDAFATSDLFIQSVNRPGYWKIYGRRDDQIIHDTGEKTNPGPLESILNQDAHIQSSVIFGRGKFQVGVLIDPKTEYSFDPMDEVKLANFRNMIWPTVQRMNELSPQHSRLFKEMITVSKPSKPFHYTAKNTPRRHFITKEYEQEIKGLYDAFADSTQSSIPSPAEWTLLASIEFVRKVVNKVLRHEVKDDQDIFQHGCDSLQATWIRNTLLRALRDSIEMDTRHLVNNFVYENPTISAMASFVRFIAIGAKGLDMEPGIDIALRASAMREMVNKYTANLPIHSGIITSQCGDEGDIVLVTGTTGALGSYLLSELVQDARVSKIYALNRSRVHDVLTLEERQRMALLERGLNATDVLDSKKIIFLEGDTASSWFGLERILIRR